MSKEKSINLKAIKKAQYFHWIWTATEQMQFSRNHDPICVNIKRDAFLEIITSEIILFIFLIFLEESETVLMFFYSSHSIRYTHKINLLCFNKHFVLWARRRRLRLRLVDGDILFDLYQLIQHPVLSVWKVINILGFDDESASTWNKNHSAIQEYERKNEVGATFEY